MTPMGNVHGVPMWQASRTSPEGSAISPLLQEPESRELKQLPQGHGAGKQERGDPRPGHPGPGDPRPLSPQVASCPSQSHVLVSGLLSGAVKLATGMW